MSNAIGCLQKGRFKAAYHWPQASILKSSFPDIEKLLQQLDLPIHELLEDPYTKCLTLRPDGMRYVVQIAQASQAHCKCRQHFWRPN